MPFRKEPTQLLRKGESMGTRRKFLFQNSDIEALYREQALDEIRRRTRGIKSIGGKLHRIEFCSCRMCRRARKFMVK